MKAFVNYISYFLPENVLSNEDLEIDFPEWSVAKISSKTGIYNRHISSKNEFSSDLAVKAVENLLRENNIEKNSIDYLILCTQSPDYFLPTTACLVQDRLGLNKSIGAIDVNQGCSGYIYSLGLAKGLILSKQVENVLIVTADTYSKYIHNKDKANKTIFGDGAAASLISNKSIGICGELKSFIYGTDGSGYDKLIVKNGGVRNRFLNGEDYFDNGSFVRNDNNLYMDGRAVFEFTNSTVPALVHAILNKEKLKLEDISLFVFHQANRFMLDKLRMRLNIPSEKFIFNSENFGNTVSSTLPISLRNLIVNNELKNGEYILLAGFGVGLSYGATILKIL